MNDMTEDDYYQVRKMVPEHYNGGGKDCFTQNDSWLEKP
jgi:hypothetical protein